MDRSQKVGLGLLALVALAFVAILVLGGGGEGQATSDLFAGPGAGQPASPCASPPPAEGWVGGLGGLLLRQSPLKARDTEASCQQGDGYRIAAGGSCEVGIPTAAFTARRACLQLISGELLQLRYLQPGTFPVLATLTPGGRKGLDIHARKEARLTLTCSGPEECRVRVR